MPRRAPLTSLKQINEINLTPLMDLTFILLITFIITFPLIEQGIMVNLPNAGADDLSADQATTITVDEQGAVYLDDLPISIDELRARMQELGEFNPEVSVYVRADEALAYGRVVEVLKILHASNVSRMALVTEKEE